MFNKPDSEAGLLSKTSCLVQPWVRMNLQMLELQPKSDLNVQQASLRGVFVKPKLRLKLQLKV
jgi:hypothetical protein